MRKLTSLQGIDIYKTAPTRYVVKYGGENFSFTNWQDVVSWIGFISKAEEKEGLVRDAHGTLFERGESNEE